MQPTLTLDNNYNDAKLLATTLRSMQWTPVLDLDGVVLDATHRQATHADGTLDLDKYRANSTWANVMADAMMPLALLGVWLTNNSLPFYVCTARPLCKGTQDKLNALGIKPNRIFHRGESQEADYILKHRAMSENFSEEQRANMVLIDDNIKNLEAVHNIGMKTVHVPFHGH